MTGPKGRRFVAVVFTDAVGSTGLTQKKEETV